KPTFLRRYSHLIPYRLLRWAIAQLSSKDAIEEETPLEGETKRFTLDMEPEEHERFSILAIRMRRKKAELARWEIERLLDRQE
ncbi:hypothetical protein, partial [Leptodesmis sp.]|uniref:hypothetical protein n=1 Tax=Leptodesmis sp. TaxID=3100501 RepID=UPI00405347D9